MIRFVFAILTSLPLLLTGSYVLAAPKVCGGIAGLKCGAGQFCNFPIKAQCGKGDMTGVCTLKPKICIKIFLPVCGCDGKTYGNACQARANGVSVMHPGRCTVPKNKK